MLQLVHLKRNLMALKTCLTKCDCRKNEWQDFKKAQKLEIFFLKKSCPALFQSALSLRAQASATTSSTVRPLRAKPSRWMDPEKWRAQSVSVSITLKRLLCLLFLCTGYPDNDRILTTVMFTRPPPAQLSSCFVCSAGCNYRPCSAALMPSHKSNFYICLKCCQSTEHVSTASVAADNGKRSKEGWTKLTLSEDWRLGWDPLLMVQLPGDAI